MNWRHLDRDLHTGLDTWHAYDSLTDETHLKTTPIPGMVENLLDQNKERYNDGTNGYISKEREFKYVAEIPTWVQVLWLQEGIDIWNKNHWEAVKRKLNSNEWQKLRTSPGTI